MTGKFLFNKKMILLGMLPGLLLYFCFFVAPSIGTFIFSFTDITQVPGKAWSFIGLNNYKELIFLSNGRDFLEALEKTFVFSISTTVIQTAFSLFMAVILCRKFVNYRNLYRTVIFMPTILGVTVTAFCFQLFFSIDGPAQKLLNLFGASSGFFGDYQWAFPLVIFCQIWMSAGYEMVIFIAGLQNIPEDIYEASNIDGSNEWQTFWKITLPMLWPTVMVNLSLCIIGSLSAFQIILMTTGGTPQTRTLSMFVYQVAFGMGTLDPNAGKQGLAAAMQIILFTFILIITVGSRYLMNKVNGED